MCFDERPCQLIGQVLTPIPPKPNSTKKEHQEYLRNGVCNVLLAYDIDTGQRYLKVTTTKTKVDYTNFMQWIVKEHYPDMTKIKLVQDNFGTHSYGAFYENLPFEEARKLKNKLERFAAAISFYPQTRFMVKYGRNGVFSTFSPMFR